MTEAIYLRTPGYEFEELPAARLTYPDYFDGILPAVWSFVKLVQKGQLTWEMQLLTDQDLGMYRAGVELWAIYSDSAILYPYCVLEKIDDGYYNVFASDCQLVKRPF